MKKENIKKMMKKLSFECDFYIKLVETVFCRFFSDFHFEKNKVIFLKLENQYLQCNRNLIFNIFSFFFKYYHILSILLNLLSKVKIFQF